MRYHRATRALLLHEANLFLLRLRLRLHHPLLFPSPLLSSSVGADASVPTHRHNRGLGGFDGREIALDGLLLCKLAELRKPCAVQGALLALFSLLFTLLSSSLFSSLLPLLSSVRPKAQTWRDACKICSSDEDRRSILK